MITNLKCEYIVEPIGIDTQKPMFSWNIEDTFMEQKNYRIIVKHKNNIYFDSGTINSNKQLQIEYDGKQLESLKKYEFEVIINSKKNISFSKKSFFVTGLLNKKDKNEKWIIHPNEHDNPIFYKDINIKGAIKEAYIAISGLGMYEFTINDIKAHDSVLAPAFTDYMERDLSNLENEYNNNSNMRVLYNTYDIKKFFKKGNNSLKVMVGNGWFGQIEKNVDGDMSYGCPRLFAKINIEYINGEKQEIVTDQSFYVTEGPYEFNNIYYGEIYNDNIGRNFSYDYNAEITNDIMGQMYSHITNYDKVIEVIEPKKIHNNIYSIDHNISGYVRISFKGVRGAKITIKYFEKINEDMTPNYESCGGKWQLQQDTYILFDSNQVTYEPKFTWHGFKYFLIEKDDDIEITSIKALKIHSDIKIKSKINTSNETVNWLYKTYTNTQLNNYHGLVPMNNPHIERAGNTNMVSLTIDSSLYSFDSYYLYMKWNKDIIACQNQQTGAISPTVPFYAGNKELLDSVAIVVTPYMIYKHTFDKRTLENSIEAIKGYIEYLKNNSKNLIINKSNSEGKYRLVNTCYFYYAVELTEIICSIIGEDDKEYTKLKFEIKKAINSEFLNTSIGRYENSNIYPLYFNIVPEEYKQLILKTLESDAMLPKTLLENNKEDLFNKLINSNKYPSFGYMKKKGATTLWKSINNDKILNSPLLGGIVNYLFEYVAGIKYINANNEIVIKPRFKLDLDKVNITYKSIYGNIKIYWEKSKNKIKINIKIPGNVKAVFVNGENIKILDKIENKFEIERV